MNCHFIYPTQCCHWHWQSQPNIKSSFYPFGLSINRTVKSVCQLSHYQVAVARELEKEANQTNTSQRHFPFRAMIYTQNCFCSTEFRPTKQTTRMQINLHTFKHISQMSLNSYQMINWKSTFFA